MLFQILVHSFYYNLADEVTAYVWIPLKSVEIYMKKRIQTPRAKPVWIEWIAKARLPNNFVCTFEQFIGMKHDSNGDYTDMLSNYMIVPFHCCLQIHGLFMHLKRDKDKWNIS